MNDEPVKLTLRIPPDLLDYIDRRAARLERSRNWTIIDAIRRARQLDPREHQ